MPAREVDTPSAGHPRRTPRALAIWLGATVTGVVALGSAVLSWDALSWGAAQLGVDGPLTWLFPVVIDGVIAMATITVLALQGAARRIRFYVWTLLVGAVSASVVGNAAHAAAGSPVHAVGSALPALALATSLHLLVILVRHVPAPDRPGEVVRPSAEPRVDTRPVLVSKVSTRPGPDTDRRAAIAAFLNGRDPSAVSVSAIARATGIPRTSAQRILSTFRPEPVLSGQADAA